MGIGHPLEASYTLAGPLPAGSYHLVADGMVAASPTVRFELVWRHGGADTAIATFTHAYPSTATAQYAETQPAAAVPAVPGDAFVLRAAVLGGDANAIFVPYGEDAPTPSMRLLTIDLP